MFLEIIISWVRIIVSVIISIPFLTLFERKVLRYRQNRKGPKKVSFLGLLQPVADGVKLVFKGFRVLGLTKKTSFLLSPILLFFIMLGGWLSIPVTFKTIFFPLSIIFLLVLNSLNVYGLFFSGWARKSKYAMLGASRGAAQTISYEVSLSFLLLLPTVLCGSLTLDFFLYKKYYRFFFIFPPVIFLWLISCLAETNRAPFDFAEGERELVSGYKIEYSSLEFALLFLGEYGRIILFRYLRSLLFVTNGFVLKVVVASIFIFIFVWARATLPRLRYDLLMDLCWKLLLPASLFLFLFVILC